MQLGAVFVTGLLSGGLTCAMVQGGLLAGLLAGERSESVKTKIQTIAMFLGAKLAIYTIAGAILGLLGSVFVLSSAVFGWLQIVAAIYMLGVVGALLEIHPVFRRFLIQPPKWAGKFARTQSRSASSFAALFLGLSTIFLPCGTTQAMMAQAISAGTWWKGLATMAIFTLGTMPLFVAFGLGMVAAGEALKQRFMQIAAAVVAIVAIISLNGGLILVGSAVYPSKVVSDLYCAISFCPSTPDTGGPSEQVAIMIDGSGYRADHSTIKAGSTVTLTLTNKNATGCQQAFTIPSLGISKIVGVGQTQQITFKAPDKPGVVAYSCSMGMYPGELTVVN